MLHEAFWAAAARLQLDLQLRPDADADFVVVDMDSLYGPLSWLQLYNAGVTVIGYTRATRCHTHFRLARDFDEAALEALLAELAILPKSGSPAAGHAEIVQALPSGQLERQPAGQVDVAASQSGSLEIEDKTQAKLLGHWLASGELRGLLRLQHETTPALVLDMDNAQYYGPRTLKPLLPLFQTPLQPEDFVLVPENADLDCSGDEQQLSRLVWFGALLRGAGKLLPQHDATARYRLSKWMQTEREYPKHLRIASALMKAPATIAETARAAMASEAEVADFLNACLAIGSAEAVLPSAESPAEAPRPGLLERLGLR
ncbi:hypothetical protein CO613_05360 [Lysobacteraceae bacterium NML07-0707]|nr:hypothetical protein CO613_05360 [Xanthomonadaceae bacterium NML07-0707]